MATVKKTATFKASLDSLEPIRDFLTTEAGKAGLDKKKTYKLNLAVDEIATNIINYGYGNSGKENENIVLMMEAGNEAFIITLEDTAEPYNPLEQELPDKEALSLPLEERPIGGLGIMLAKMNVDEFSYEYKNGKNRNIFSVKLKP